MRAGRPSFVAAIVGALRAGVTATARWAARACTGPPRALAPLAAGPTAVPIPPIAPIAPIAPIPTLATISSRRTAPSGPPLARLVDAGLRAAAAYDAPRELARHQLGHRRRHLDERVSVAHLDLSDLRPGYPRRRGHGGDQLLRSHAVPFAEVHEQHRHWPR